MARANSAATFTDFEVGFAGIATMTATLGGGGRRSGNPGTRGITAGKNTPCANTVTDGMDRGPRATENPTGLRAVPVLGGQMLDRVMAAETDQNGVDCHFEMAPDQGWIMAFAAGPREAITGRTLDGEGGRPFEDIEVEAAVPISGACAASVRLTWRPLHDGTVVQGCFSVDLPLLEGDGGPALLSNAEVFGVISPHVPGCEIMGKAPGMCGSGTGALASAGASIITAFTR